MRGDALLRLARGLGLGAVLLGPTVAGAGATDIVRVEDVIAAPRLIFGRTEAQVERALGPPATREPGAVSSYRDPAVLYRVRRLGYPGLVVDVLDSGAVRRVRITGPGRALPYGLDVGTTAAEVQRVLGEPQGQSDRHLMYLNVDGLPDTASFYLRDGRVRLIEWDYGSTE
jgi:hypothetical protein